MEPHYHLHFTIPSQQRSQVALDIAFYLGVLHETMFGQYLVSICRIFACSVLVIYCHQMPYVSLVYSIQSLLKLTSYCLQLVWALSHSSMRGLTQFNLLLLFSHSLCNTEFLALLMIKQQSLQGSNFWHIYCMFCCFICFCGFNSYI